MSQKIEALPWDSEFFGAAVGRVDLNGVDPAGFAAIVEEARDRGFECVYGSHTPDLPERSLWAQDAGFRFIDAHQLVHRPAGPYQPPPSPSTSRHATEDDLEVLEPYLDLLAPWSRFGADPRFGPDAARRMFRAWIHRALRDPDRLVTITEDDDGITGIGTHVYDGTHRIDLLGVIRPGTNASRLHIAELVAWANEAETTGGPCAARNLAPLRFLEHCGYKLRSVVYTHHWWADGAGGRS